MGFEPTTLKDQVAIVTGGGTGIGRGISMEMAKAGADVVLASRSLEHLEPWAERIREESEAKVLVVQTDVRDWDQCQRMVERATDEFGRADILVNNAAGNFTINPEDLTVNGWQAVLNIDLNGTWFCTRAVFPVLKEQGKGSIINILAFTDRGAPRTVHAGAAKAGIWNMTMSLAAAWGQYGIRFNAITPGGVPTLGTQRNLRRSLHPGDPDDLGGEDAVIAWQGGPANNPLGRSGRSEDIGNACVFLASDMASWITGAHIHVDSGGRFGAGLGRERGEQET